MSTSVYFDSFFLLFLPFLVLCAVAFRFASCMTSYTRTSPYSLASFCSSTPEQNKQVTFHTLCQYTPPTPTRLNCPVESRRRCVHNSQLVGGSLDESEQIWQQRSRGASCRRRERTRLIGSRDPVYNFMCCW